MSSMKDTIKAMEARIEALEKQLATMSVSNVKPKRKQKSSSDSEEKPKREFKPSAARDAWRALCDSVRAVHKKDAMKIAKILKESGHMTPSEKQIEAAIKQFEETNESEEVVNGGTQYATDVEQTSASEAEVEEEKPVVPAKKASRKAK